MDLELNKEESKGGNIMLNKDIKITIYGSSGVPVYETRIKELPCRSDGSLTTESSRLIVKGILEVENGGAMFIEQVWSK